MTLKKIILLLIFTILILGGYLAGVISTNAKIYPSDYYYFLKPKISHERALSVPLDMHEGEIKEYYFWITPESKPNFLYIFQVDNYIPHLSLKYQGISPKKHGGLINHLNSLAIEDILNIKIYRSSQDENENLLIDDFNVGMFIERKNQEWVSFSKPLGYKRHLNSTDLDLDKSYSHGLYVLRVEVLKTISDLKDNNIAPIISLQSFSGGK